MEPNEIRNFYSLKQCKRVIDRMRENPPIDIDADGLLDAVDFNLRAVQISAIGELAAQVAELNNTLKGTHHA